MEEQIKKRLPIAKGHMELNIQGHIVRQDAAIWKNISKDGDVYFSGYVGGNKLVLFPQKKEEPKEVTTEHVL